MRKVGPEIVGGARAERLVRAGAVAVLDVRAPDEYARLGHIPGARLVPIDFLVAAPAVLRDERRPVLVVCEYGLRSYHAARYLVRAGMRRVLVLSGGLSRWTGPRSFEPGRVEGPSPWLLRSLPFVRPRGRVLDVACGAGRHALLLAAAGWDVHAVDGDTEAVDWLSRTAHRLGLPVHVVLADLEAGRVDLGRARYDGVLVFRYLHRPLFPALRRALKPGGVLIYETFTTAPAARGRPTDPDHLLRPGELAALVAPLEVLDAHEGDVDGASLAAVVARRPPVLTPRPSARSEPGGSPRLPRRGGRPPCRSEPGASGSSGRTRGPAPGRRPRSR